jgi:prophage regulatory protein
VNEGVTAKQLYHRVITKTIDRLLTKKDVAAALGVTERTIERLVSRGLFPGPIKLGHRVARWKPATVEAYLNRAANAG